MEIILVPLQRELKVFHPLDVTFRWQRIANLARKLTFDRGGKELIRNSLCLDNLMRIFHRYASACVSCSFSCS
jgi:hypothetical protein